MSGAIAGEMVKMYGGILGNVLSYDAAQTANRINQQNAQETRAFDERMWHMANEYNTPANQVLRMREAGLNPAYMMGQSGVLDTGNANSPVKGQLASPMVAPTYGNPFESLNPQAMAQTQLAESQAENLDADTLAKLKDIPKKEIEIKEIEQNIENLKSTNEQLKAQTSAIKSQEYTNLITSLSAVALDGAEMDKLRLEGQLTQKEIDAFDSRLKQELALIRANINKLNADASVQRQLAEQIKQEIEHGNADFASEYGTTTEEIVQSIQRKFELAKSQEEFEQILNGEDNSKFGATYRKALKIISLITSPVSTMLNGVQTGFDAEYLHSRAGAARRSSTVRRAARMIR